jgi:hypothetical protein
MRKEVPFALAATLAALLTVPATYALLRGYEVLFRSEPDPATIVWSAKTAMFWRLAIGTYFAGMVVPLGYVAARLDLTRTMRVLSVLAYVVAALITVQGLCLP